MAGLGGFLRAILWVGAGSLRRRGWLGLMGGGKLGFRRAAVAQWIERLPPEQKAEGSSPFGRAICHLS